MPERTIAPHTAPDNLDEQRCQVDRTSAALCLAAVHLEQLSRALSPGITTAVAAMLGSDIDSAHQRVQWIRERLTRESEERAA